MRAYVSILSLLYLVSADYFGQPAIIYPYTLGWYKQRQTYYYDFGARSPSNAAGTAVISAPLIVLVTGFNANGPITVPGQHNISPFTTDDAGYSDLWGVVFLTVPAGYVANSVTDYDVATATFTNRTAGPFVNCPLVPLNSTLIGGEKPITLGWYKNRTIHYFDFGVSPTFTVPILIVPNAVPLQHNVIDSIPSDVGYSAFWQKNIFQNAPANYTGDSAKSAADLLAAGIGVPTVPGIPNVVNCPVVRTDNATYFSQSAIVFPYIQGWYKDREVLYYNFGGNSPSNPSGTTVLSAPLYVLITGFDNNTNPIKVPGQHNISPFILGDAGYSDLWQVIFVTVPANYVANNITDVNTLLALNYPSKVGPLVNCPAVPLYSRLVGGELGLTYGWYKNQIFHYFDFGPSPSFTIPIYVVLGATPPQHNIIDFAPSDGPAYSAFWQKNIFNAPAGYVGDSARSRVELLAVPSIGSATIPNGNSVVNCPVVTVFPAPTGGSSAASGSKTASISGVSSLVPMGVLAVLVLFLVL